MNWNKIKSSYPDVWYELIDYIADPGIFHERRIRIENGKVAADSKTDDDNWFEVDVLDPRDLYEFFEQSGIFVVIMYNEWFGYFSYEIYSELRNEISRMFDSRIEAETDAFMCAFEIMDKQKEII